MSSIPSTSRSRSGSIHLIKSDPEPPKSDFNIIIVLFTLYTIHGACQGFFQYTIPIYFLERGASFDDLTIISLSYTPFCIKFLLSPLLNNVYSKSFGRGKSYIVPAQYFLGVLMMLLSSYGVKIVHRDSLQLLNIVSVLVTFSLMFSDIVLDRWIVNLLKPENSSYGAICQNIGSFLFLDLSSLQGMVTGLFVSFNILLPLSSAEFCNKYIYFEPSDSPLVPIHIFVLLFGISVFLVGTVVHLFVEENEVETIKSHSINDLIDVVNVFLKNSHFRKLLIIYLTWNLVFGPIHNTYPSLVVSFGVSKELFTALYTPIVPLELCMTFFIGHICKTRSDTSTAEYFWVTRFLSTFVVYGGLCWLFILPGAFKIGILFLASALSQITLTGANVAFMLYATRVSKETFGAPMLSTFGAITWFSRFLTDWLSFELLEIFEWEMLGKYTLITILLYGILFLKGPLKFETLSPKKFLVRKEKEN